jgi:hypothetical protein
MQKTIVSAEQHTERLRTLRSDLQTIVSRCCLYRLDRRPTFANLTAEDLKAIQKAAEAACHPIAAAYLAMVHHKALIQPHVEVSAELNMAIYEGQKLVSSANSKMAPKRQAAA